MEESHFLPLGYFIYFSFLWFPHCFWFRLLVELSRMTSVPKPLKHTMPQNDTEAQNEVEAQFGVRPCLWQLKVVRKILEQDDVITIVATGSGKSLTYWMPLLLVKHGIVIIVTRSSLSKYSLKTRSVPSRWQLQMHTMNFLRCLFDCRWSHLVKLKASGYWFVKVSTVVTYILHSEHYYMAQSAVHSSLHCVHSPLKCRHSPTPCTHSVAVARHSTMLRECRCI